MNFRCSNGHNILGDRPPGQCPVCSSRIISVAPAPSAAPASAVAETPPKRGLAGEIALVALMICLATLSIAFPVMWRAAKPNGIDRQEAKCAEIARCPCLS